jgi:hypothetical protein
MQLNKNYRIIFDENNTVLQFFEMREKTKKETKETTTFEYTENYYYPNIKTALKSFLNKSLDGSNNVEEVLKRVDEVESVINNLKI